MRTAVPPPSYVEACFSPPQPPPSRSHNFYERFPWKPNLLFRLHPDPSKPRDEQPWVGELFVKAPSVARLMREGFFVAEANVIGEEGYITLTEDHSRFEGEEALWRRQYRFTRHYVLRDLQDPPRWAAHLMCRARDLLPELAGIRINDFTHHHVHLCMASRIHRGLVYYFRVDKGGINAIYENMPLEGLWPWPRRLGEIVLENTAQGVPRPLEPPTYDESCNPTPIPPATAGASSWNRYDAPKAIFFQILPDPRLARGEQLWFGRLSVKTDNVPQVMKEGLAITPESILQEEGCVQFTKDAPEDWMNERWPYTRHWYLRDMAQHDDGGARAGWRTCRAWPPTSRRSPGYGRATSPTVKLTTARPRPMAKRAPGSTTLTGSGPASPSTASTTTCRWKGCGRIQEAPKARRGGARQELQQEFSSRMRELIREADRNRQLRDSTQ
ncbi:hypothetical protein PG988_004608 [Apiospora saccharicola]